MKTHHVHFITTTLLASTVLFTACQPSSQAKTSEPLEAFGDTGTVTLAVTPDPSSPQNATTPPASSPTTQKGSGMKTLQDFEKITATKATLITSKGEITFTLFADKAPLTVTNFLNLAKSGFYDGVRFHRIIEDFMAQVGDPLSKDESQKAMWGTGGPGYRIADEFSPELKHDKPGIVSMANAGPNTGGSQFFITYEPTPWLDGKHAVFGEVTKGMDVLKKLEIGDTILSVKYE